MLGHLNTVDRTVTLGHIRWATMLGYSKRTGTFVWTQ